MNLKYFNLKNKTDREIVIESKHKKINILFHYNENYYISIVDKRNRSNRRKYVIEKKIDIKRIPDKYIEMVEHCMLTLKLSQK